MTRAAAIDCGTNSIRLLVSDLPGGAGSAKHDLVREMRIVRLGYGVDRTGHLDDAALARTFEACEAYAAVVREHGVETLRFCATSATRDADNEDVFVAGVRERLGVQPDVLSGAEEAALSFAGAVHDLPESQDPVLVVDIGGGSTEVILGAEGAPRTAHSLDIGSVRMTERHLHGDPPTPDEVAACARDVDEAFEQCSADLARARTLVGVAGTVTTLAAHALDLSAYVPERLHHARIGFDQVADSCAAILAARVDERRAMPFMHPGRADVIGGGAVILQRLLERLDLPDPVLLVSEHDILDGIVWSQR